MKTNKAISNPTRKANIMGNQYEYKCVDIQGNSEEISAKLTEYGKVGWKIVHIEHPQGSTYRAILEKPYENPEYIQSFSIPD